MRALSIALVGAALMFSVQADAKDKAQKSSQDEGAMRNKCRAEVTGYGVGAQAQFRACMQRARSR